MEETMKEQKEEGHQHKHGGCGNPNCGCASKKEFVVKEHKCGCC